MPISPHPHSAELINASRQIHIKHSSQALHCNILTIDALQTLQWHLPSYLSPFLSHSHTLALRLLLIDALLCELNNVRQAFLSCDRAWNIETTEHYRPGFTHTVYALIYRPIKHFFALFLFACRLHSQSYPWGVFNLFSFVFDSLTLGSVCEHRSISSTARVSTREQSIMSSSRTI